MYKKRGYGGGKREKRKIFKEEGIKISVLLTSTGGKK